MGSPEAYRRNAADCIRVAQQIHSPSDKPLLLDMAQKWQALAERIEAEGEEPPARTDRMDQLIQCGTHRGTSQRWLEIMQRVPMADRQLEAALAEYDQHQLTGTVQ